MTIGKDKKSRAQAMQTEREYALRAEAKRACEELRESKFKAADVVLRKHRVGPLDRAMILEAVVWEMELFDVKMDMRMKGRGRPADLAGAGRANGILRALARAGLSTEDEEIKKKTHLAVALEAIVSGGSDDPRRLLRGKRLTYRAWGRPPRGAG